MKYTIVLLTAVLCIVSLSSMAMAGDCETCSGYVDWYQVPPLGCKDPASTCFGLSNCMACMYVMNFGSCVASESGSCSEDTYGYTRAIYSYTHIEPSTAQKVICYLAYLLHEDDFVYCVCINTGECVLEDLNYVDWDGPGCTG